MPTILNLQDIEKRIIHQEDHLVIEDPTNFAVGVAVGALAGALPVILINFGKTPLIPAFTCCLSYFMIALNGTIYKFRNENTYSQIKGANLGYLLTAPSSLYANYESIGNNEGLLNHVFLSLSCVNTAYILWKFYELKAATINTEALTLYNDLSSLGNPRNTIFKYHGYDNADYHRYSDVELHDYNFNESDYL